MGGPEPSPIRSFEDLIVWQKAMEVADLVLAMTEEGPLSRRFRLVDQIVAAATSISANIAEGHDGGSRKVYLRHLYIARGSSAETVTFLRIIAKRGYVDPLMIAPINSLLTEVRRMLNALINRIGAQPDDPDEG